MFGGAFGTMVPDVRHNIVNDSKTFYVFPLFKIGDFKTLGILLLLLSRATYRYCDLDGEKHIIVLHIMFKTQNIFIMCVGQEITCLVHSFEDYSVKKL